MVLLPIPPFVPAIAITRGAGEVSVFAMTRASSAPAVRLSRNPTVQLSGCSARWLSGLPARRVARREQLEQPRGRALEGGARGGGERRVAEHRRERGEVGKLYIRGAGRVRAQLAAEIDRRVPLFAAGVPRPTGPRWGQCDVCHDPMRAHEGGMCFLCVAACRRARAARAQVAA